jgi:Flp pilus assembly protein TadD
VNKLATTTAIVCLLIVRLIARVPAFAGDLKIPIPERGKSTPVQKLNRDGVAELKRGHLEKAKKVFYRAYLLDPGDPFTLNNLGYVAELDGDADRALRYYALAAKDHTDAIIDLSSEAALKGKPLDAAFRQVGDSDREISKISEQAIVLLKEGHLFEARNLLRSVLDRYPQDPFLLNNLGYTTESLGDLEGALRYYSAAASVHSTKPVTVTPRQKWRGRPISEVAASNAAAVNEQISRGEGTEATTARLNLRGVVALNDNNPSAARQFFLQAYNRDAQNAFTLNNLGYIAEIDGDWESAQSLYEAARSGRDANERVSYSTRRDDEGQKVDNMADENQVGVETSLKAIQQARRRANNPVGLVRRDASPESSEPAKPVPPVGVQPPPLPALPPPGSEQDRNQQNPQHPPDSQPQ